MVEAVSMTGRRSGLRIDRVTTLRLVSVAGALILWEAIARSGLLYEDVVPTLEKIVWGVWNLVTDPEFYPHVMVTIREIVLALAIGGTLGIICGLVIGGNPFLAKIFEPLIYYLGPTPKIIFLPLLIMWFGIAEGSKIAMGSISTFFPVVLSVASGMRGINPVLIRVGRSFRASRTQMAFKIYFPAMREPLINSARLAFGVSVIGILLSETKFATAGLGFMVTRFYQQFDMPAMYGLIIVIFAFAIMVNSLLGRFSSSSAF